MRKKSILKNKEKRRYFNTIITIQVMITKDYTWTISFLNLVTHRTISLKLYFEWSEIQKYSITTWHLEINII